MRAPIFVPHSDFEERPVKEMKKRASDFMNT